MANYNQDAWRLVEEKVREVVAKAVADAVAAHEAKTDITNAHASA